MKTQNILMGAAVAVVLGSGVAAQSPQSDDRRNQQGKNSSISVTGCLMSEPDKGTGGAAGSTSRATGGNRFVLMYAATTEGGSRTDASRSDKESSAVAGARGGASYVLEGKASELRQHANQLVEISGRLDTDTSGSSTNSGSSSTRSGTADRDSTPRSGASADSGSSAARSVASQRLHVESFRMIASSCSR